MPFKKGTWRKPIVRPLGLISTTTKSSYHCILAKLFMYKNKLGDIEE